MILLAFWRSLTKKAGSGSESGGSINQRYGSPDPDPYQNCMDPQHWGWERGERDDCLPRFPSLWLLVKRQMKLAFCHYRQLKVTVGTYAPAFPLHADTDLADWNPFSQRCLWNKEVLCMRPVTDNPTYLIFLDLIYSRTYLLHTFCWNTLIRNNLSIKETGSRDKIKIFGQNGYF